MTTLRVSRLSTLAGRSRLRGALDGPPGTGRKRPTLTRSGPLSIDDIRRDWAVLEANMTADAGFEHRYLEPFAWAPIFMLARGRGLGRAGSPLTVEGLATKLGTSPRAAELMVQQLHAMQLATEGPAPGQHALTRSVGDFSTPRDPRRSSAPSRRPTRTSWCEPWPAWSTARPPAAASTGRRRPRALHASSRVS